MPGTKNFRIYDPSDPKAYERLSSVDTSLLDHPGKYVPDERLVDAVNVAIRLGKPLLLTGEPGTGKTQLAYNLAYTLQIGPTKAKEVIAGGQSAVKDFHIPFRFTAQHNSLAQDIFYRYDSLQHFSDANANKIKNTDGDTELDIDKYIRYGALGEAIMLAKNDEKRSVVLIDEIDKAPREFPNDLLEAIEDFRFTIKEKDGPPIEAPKNLKPIVIITSNREKMLPDAFLRRCIYYHIVFPSMDKIKEIVRSRLYGDSTEKQASSLRFEDKELDSLLTHFAAVRDLMRKKKPSTSELLGWLQILNTYTEFSAQNLSSALTPSDIDILRLSYTVLAKHESDLQILENQFLGK